MINFKALFRKKAFIVGVAIYITFILMSMLPYIAESHMRSRQNMDDTYDYHLIFETDGKNSHYDVTRVNANQNGEIILTYTTASHTLEVNTKNLEKVTIDCESIYYDESMKVFKRDPSSDTNYYKSFFTDHAMHFTVNVVTDHPLKELRFKYAPEPEEVWVDDSIVVEEWWEAKINYEYVSTDIVLTQVPMGSTNVELYFKDRPLPEATFSTDDKNTYIKNGILYGSRLKVISFDARASNDDIDGGTITDYSWDFGDGGQGMGPTPTYRYTRNGVYLITLTVTDDIGQEGEYSQSITIEDVDAAEKKDDEGMFGLGKVGSFDVFILLLLIILIIIILIGAVIARRRSKAAAEEVVEEEVAVAEEEEEAEEVDEEADVYECPECGDKISADDTSCPSCGVEFADDEEGTEVFECPECGANITSDDTACPSCGVEFEEDEEEEGEEEEGGEEEEEEEFECPDCGGSISADDTKCPECGAEFED